MENLELKDFRDDDEFEMYLADNFQWQGWTLFQNNVVLGKHKTIGLIDSETGQLVAAMNYIRMPDSDQMFIYLFQVRDDIQRKGYGTKFFRMIQDKFDSKFSGYRLQYLSSALGFWLKQGFEFDDEPMFMYK